jgi:ESCRT-I complex subunit VPS37
MYNASAASATVEACGTLQQLNRIELQKLMDDSDALNQLIDDMSLVKKLEKDKEGLLVTNASLAEYNLSLEPRLLSARQELADTYKKAVELQKQHERNLLRLDSVAVNTSPEATLAVLQTELAKVEEESENLAERYSSGAAGASADIETFVSQYLRLRTLAHLRRIKVDKLTEMLRESHQRAPPQQQQYAREAVAVTSAVPPIPARMAPIRPFVTSSAACPPVPPVAGIGWSQMTGYPPIADTSVAWPACGVSPYPTTAQMAHPVSYMQR